MISTIGLALVMIVVIMGLILWLVILTREVRALKSVGSSGSDVDPEKVTEVLNKSKELRGKLTKVTEANVPASKELWTPPQG